VRRSIDQQLAFLLFHHVFKGGFIVQPLSPFDSRFVVENFSQSRCVTSFESFSDCTQVWFRQIFSPEGTVYVHNFGLGEWVKTVENDVSDTIVSALSN
jgi:hypothetical protein